MKKELFSRVFKNKGNLFTFFVILLLTLISYRFIYVHLIYSGPGNNEETLARQKEGLKIQKLILSGEIAAHYQYRVLKPIAGTILQEIISPFVKDPIRRYLISYKLLIFFVFLGTFFVFSLFLRLFYSTIISIIGLCLLQVVIPLSIETPFYWMDDNFYNLLFYTIGLYVMFKNKDHYLPLLFLIGTLNREQFIFLNVIYAIYLLCEKKSFTKRGIVILIVNTLVYFAVYLGLKFYFGFKQSYATVAFETSFNIQNWDVILRVWAEGVAVFVILCILVYKKSNLFFKYSFLSLGIYIVLFFLNGHMHELAKFLPAYLIMIPMCLKLLEETTREEKVPHKKI